jgi:hypothetical protein
MGFLRRLLGGGDPAPAEAPPLDAAALDEEERARELELARFDQERVDDLIRRQQQYADRSWTPPAQGGERRADDADAEPAGS